jgi:hypothetical protein
MKPASCDSCFFVALAFDYGVDGSNGDSVLQLTGGLLFGGILTSTPFLKDQVCDGLVA